MSRKTMLMMLGLGVLLTVSGVPQGAAGTALQAPSQRYAGQVKEIKIDQCGLQPGTCEGSLVLTQPRGQAVALAIPPGTEIQRGNQQVYLDELGVGNYIMVQAAPLPSETPPIFGIEGQLPRDGGSQVGTNMGERTPTLHEANEP